MLQQNDIKEKLRKNTEEAAQRGKEDKIFKE